MQVTSQLHHILGATMRKGQAPNESLCRRTERTIKDEWRHNKSYRTGKCLNKSLWDLTHLEQLIPGPMV